MISSLISMAVKVRDRIKSVLLWSENWSLGQIAQALRIHETTVSTYLKEYLLGKINIKSGGSESFLSAQQSDMLISHLHSHTYQAGYHRAKSVTDSASQSNIELHFLPPYSPNLNPIERLWQVMNEKARNNRFFKSAKDFESSIIHFFENTLPQLSDILSTRITDNFELIWENYISITLLFNVH